MSQDPTMRKPRPHLLFALLASAGPSAGRGIGASLNLDESFRFEILFHPHHGDDPQFPPDRPVDDPEGAYAEQFLIGLSQLWNESGQFREACRMFDSLHDPAEANAYRENLFLYGSLCTVLQR